MEVPEVPLGGTPPVKIVRLQLHRRGRRGHPANRTETHPHILNELATEPAGAATNQFRTKSSRQPFRWTFCQRNALSQK